MYQSSDYNYSDTPRGRVKRPLRLEQRRKIPTASTGVSNASFLTPETSHLSISVVVISYMNIFESTLESNDEELTRDASAGGTFPDEHEASARAAVAQVEKVSITAGIWQGCSMWKATRAHLLSRCEIRVCRRGSAWGR